ncbi:MAG: SDR family oxidoreductase [Betaproteobacteria bacterium]|nr:SDR family oxidoreductase [Betaproteobacteria bacterium]
MATLTGKVALVTGASRGIGRATALALSKAGAAVYLAADGTREELSAAAAECRAHNAFARAEFGMFDLADAADVQRMVDAALAIFGRVDILVNNAGIRIRHPFGDYAAAEFDQLVAVNVRAPFLASQAVVPSMRANGGGRIITVASQNGIVAAANSALYGLSKAALIYLTKAMALELAKDKIMVNAVSPGPIETEFTRARMEREPGHREARQARVPLGRWGRPEEVAQAILFLASTEATFVHGSNLVIDGGYVIH